MKPGPTITRGRSRQDYATPPDFMAAVSCKFGEPAWDLAATAENTKAQCFFTPEQDSLKQNWHNLNALCWLNPPFDNIGKWAEKCYWETIYGNGLQILFLVPASVGSNWFRDYVFRKSFVYFLNGRITFTGCTDPYPKDMILCHYGVLPGEAIWKWK